MRHLRTLSLLAFVMALAACSSDASNGPSAPRRVAVFSDTQYVDFDTTDLWSSAPGLYIAARERGFPVARFAATADSTVDRVIATTDVIVFPDGSEPAWQAMSATARTRLTSFVAAGGTVILAGWETAIADSILGAHLVHGYPDSAQTRLQPVAAQGTSFAGGPQRLPIVDNVDAVKVSSLPPNALALYTMQDGDGAPGAQVAWVAAMTKGEGQVIYLGWDWGNSVPRGGQDGGWQDVLARAIRF